MSTRKPRWFLIAAAALPLASCADKPESDALQTCIGASGRMAADLGESFILCPRGSDTLRIAIDGAGKPQGAPVVLARIPGA